MLRTWNAALSRDQSHTDDSYPNTKSVLFCYTIPRHYLTCATPGTMVRLTRLLPVFNYSIVLSILVAYSIDGPDFGDPGQIVSLYSKI